jgi:hypothetical protein
MNRIAARCLGACTLSLVLLPSAWAQQPSREVYKCPQAGGNPLYTDTLSAKEAREKGCRTLEGAPITIVQGAKPRSPAPAGAKPETGARSTDERVTSSTQRARDSDRRQILEEELKREEDRLGVLQQDYKNGEPDRRGDERNYQKYLDRVAGMKADIARKEADIAAIKRELAKLPPSAANQGGQ